MSIQELSQKFKTLLVKEDVLLSVLIIVVSCASFALGRASLREGIESHSTGHSQQTASAHQVSQDNIITSTSSDTAVSTSYVASKSGTKYHLPWCPGAKQIKEENKMYFATKEEAERAGYSPASNCKGI